MSHKQLKEIVELIEYNLSYIYIYDKDAREFQERYNEYSESDDEPYFEREINLVEIIFTPEFMAKFNFYMIWTKGIELKDLAQIQCTMFDNLHDPVSYLFKTLGLWQNK